jgi:phage terminase large subunit-like protein
MDKQKVLELVQAREKKLSQRVFYSLFPDNDLIWNAGENALFRKGDVIHARHKYERNLEFFRATKNYREICLMAANRTLKTVSGCYLDTVFLTGLYPHWWEGRVFKGPTHGTIAGKTNETTRDILQHKLFGKIVPIDGRKTFDGTGIVPFENILDVSWKQGVADLFDTVQIRHVSGGISTISAKSYQQGRGAIEGVERDFLHVDEEPDSGFYGEALIRTMTTGGLIYLTFTPLDGMSDVVMSFLPKPGVGTLGKDKKRPFNSFLH